MFRPSSFYPDAIITQVAKIPPGTRWCVYRRLQELEIPCWCPDDGSLWSGVENCIHAILVRSTVQQFVAPRQELVDWLERCWETCSDSEMDAFHQTIPSREGRHNRVGKKK